MNHCMHGKPLLVSMRLDDDCWDPYRVHVDSCNNEKC